MEGLLSNATRNDSNMYLIFLKNNNKKKNFQTAIIAYVLVMSCFGTYLFLHFLHLSAFNRTYLFGSIVFYRSHTNLFCSSDRRLVGYFSLVVHNQISLIRGQLIFQWDDIVSRY